MVFPSSFKGICCFIFFNFEFVRALYVELVSIKPGANATHLQPKLPSSFAQTLVIDSNPALAAL